MVPSRPFDMATSTLPPVMTCKGLAAALGVEELDVGLASFRKPLLWAIPRNELSQKPRWRDGDLQAVGRLRRACAAAIMVRTVKARINMVPPWRAFFRPDSARPPSIQQEFASAVGHIGGGRIGGTRTGFHFACQCSVVTRACPVAPIHPQNAQKHTWSTR